MSYLLLLNNRHVIQLLQHMHTILTKFYQAGCETLLLRMLGYAPWLFQYKCNLDSVFWKETVDV